MESIAFDKEPTRLTTLIIAFNSRFSSRWLL